MSTYPTVAVLSGTSYSLGIAIKSVMMSFGWKQFAFVYSNRKDDLKCSIMKNDLQDAFSVTNDVVITIIIELKKVEQKEVTEALREVSLRARIIVVCLAEGYDNKRTFVLAAKDGGFLNKEYIYIFADTKSKGFSIPLPGGKKRSIWESVRTPNDGRDAEAMEAFGETAVISDHMGTGAAPDNYDEFSKEVIARMREPPFYCVDDCQGEEYSYAAAYAGQLYDGVYAYARALNSTLKKNATALRNGTAIMENIEMTFDGMSGVVKINDDGMRRPMYYFDGLDNNSQQYLYGTISVEGSRGLYKPSYSSETELWWTRGGIRPRDEPLCGFTGNECPRNFFEEHLAAVVVVAVVVAVMIIAAIVSICYVVYLRKKDIERANKLWQVPYSALEEINSKTSGVSRRSLQSGTSTIARASIDVQKGKRNYIFYCYQKECVASMKHEAKDNVATRHQEIRQMRELTNDNLNRFIGFCLDGPQMMSLWKYCSRGSLNDVIIERSTMMDSFFICSLLRDVIHGLHFIHHSFLRYHGLLTSKCCLVDEHWQVKISSYGLQDVRKFDKLSTEDLLWTAPEILRQNDMSGTQQGDIYSLAIICAQLVTKSSPWDLSNRKEDAEEILYMVKRGGSSPYRPSLLIDDEVEVNPSLLQLIRDCWAERPTERPTITTVKMLVRDINSNRRQNLMDYVFNILEQYASTLEEEVAERTKELVEEKKKSDILLHRMLPRQVAEKLKLGQTVEPETFESVTVFFSDVVSFTKIAAKGTPLQVVNLLNELYTIFDGIINEHDVYKVETIGDGYLCVSGLPHRNGNEHIKEICSMSLDFMNSLKNFNIPHLPNDRILLRIGVHTGSNAFTTRPRGSFVSSISQPVLSISIADSERPSGAVQTALNISHAGSVVAGVVGLTMPRYCLFGDTVNTASRMESNGKPEMIHLSSDATNLLLVVGGFKVTTRGEVMIKGKGVMETFWLLERSNGENDPSTSLLASNSNLSLEKKNQTDCQAHDLNVENGRAQGIENQ